MMNWQKLSQQVTMTRPSQSHALFSALMWSHLKKLKYNFKNSEDKKDEP
jgi:hypothetical protein